MNTNLNRSKVNKIKLLYIAGYGRSGTTLLDRLLGQTKDIFSVGEFKLIWNRSFKGNQLCGCGAKFYECNFWKQTCKDAFNKPIEVIDNINEILFLQHSVDRIRCIPFLKSGTIYKNMMKYCDKYVYPLYSSIIKNCEKQMIVDSSKAASYLYILALYEFIDLYVVHLVRDSRAVAYSWCKSNYKLPEIVEINEYMDKFSPFETSVRWNLTNTLIYRINKYIPKQRYLRVNYEELASYPKKTITNIIKFLNIDDELEFFLQDNVVSLKTNHTVAGNPMRFKNGEITIKLDDEWKEKMSKIDKTVVNLLTFGCLNKYC